MQQRVNDHFNVGLKKEVTRILAVQRLLRKQNYNTARGDILDVQAVKDLDKFKVSEEELADDSIQQDQNEGD